MPHFQISTLQSPIRVFVFACACVLVVSWLGGRLATADDAAGLPSTVGTGESTYTKPSSSELRRRLTPMQYRVTQQSATETAFRNAYWNNKDDGTYDCIVCDQPLFKSSTKFKSGTGWPSFYEPIEPAAVGFETDYKMLFPRKEVHCSRCGSHLGHVFNDGPPPTGQRYCMNSASLQFEAEK